MAMSLVLFFIMSFAQISWSALQIDHEWTSNQIHAVQVKAKEGDSVAEEILGYLYMYGITGGHIVTISTNARDHNRSKRAIRSHMDLPTFEDLLPWLGNREIVTHREPRAYDETHELEPDYITAAYWLRKAADQGNAFAQCHLAVLYAEGKGVKQDFLEAAKWLKKSTAAGNVKAEYYLAHLYLEGKGVKESGPEAAALLLKAAATSGDAQLDLGLLYGTGRPDFPQNYKEAFYWLSVASGDARPFESHLTTSDKEEVKARRLRWYDDYQKHYNTQPPPENEEHLPRWLPKQ